MKMKVKLKTFFSRFCEMGVTQHDNVSLQLFPQQDQELEIDLVDDEPPFLRGQTKWSANMSPVRIVKVCLFLSHSN